MESLQEVFCTSLALFHAGDVERAGTILTDGLSRFADASCLWELQQLLQHDEDRWSIVTLTLERASYDAPLSPEASFTLALCYLRQSKTDLGALLIRRLAIAPNTPLWLLPLVASQLGTLHEPAHALKACRRILDSDASRHDAHFGVGYYLRMLNLPRSTYRAAFQTAHELAPHVSLYRVVLAGILEADGELDEVRELLRGVNPAEVRCPGTLRKMMQLHSVIDNRRGVEQCRSQLNRLGSSRGCNCGPHAPDESDDD